MLHAAMLVLASATGISLQLSSPQRAVLAGEPVKLVLHWKATTPTVGIVIEDGEFTSRRMGFLVSQPGIPGERRYAEMARGTRPEVTVYRDLGSGEAGVENYVLVDGWYEPPSEPNPREILFAVPGTYSVRVACLDEKRATVLAYSNALVFEVSAPTGDDAVVAEALRADPRLIGGLKPHAALEQFIRAHSESKYIPWLKHLMYGEVAASLRNNRDPETGESWFPLGKAEANARAAAVAAKVCNEIQQDEWGPLEEERLWALALWARTAGNPVLSASAREQIRQRFPNSRAAAEVTEWEDAVREARAFDAEADRDKTAPAIVVSSSPSSLWPPNHKMVAVNVTVNVSDDIDPNPAVKLVSITCDDGCDPTLDVAGAAPETDDRQFQLRAERSGGGAGRTYTITYSAKDAAGNVSTKAAAVVVPHDQGKK
jgi:hypothetical protein